MKRIFSLLLMVCLAVSAHAQDLAQSVRQQLAQPQVLRGEFEQSKQVQGFARPLVSRGSFVVAKEKGVLWSTAKPFASQLRLTRDEILATQANGAVAFRLDASKEPAVRVINGLMFSLLGGDLGGLAEHFRIDGEAGAKGWSLVLTPKSSSLAKLMSRIELAGDKYVRSIRIAEANGDQTQIRFSAQTSEPAALSAEEAQRFE